MPKTPPVEPTPEQRLKQIAAILANDVIHCKRHLCAVASEPEQVFPQSCRVA
jgi:hypothetical protein